LLHRQKYPKWLSRSLVFAWGVILAVILFPIASDDVRMGMAQTLYDTHDQVLVRKATADNYWRFQAHLDKIDPNYISAVLAIEDERFFSHSGVDMPAILRALKSWHDKGQIVSGASTLTMQLVRQYEPRPRVVKSKAIEAFAALKYELVFSKDEILSQYLTRISYGGNIQGVEAASWKYFGKTPQSLTWDEIALLVALPQAPESRRPDRHPVAAKAGRDRILDKLSKAGLLSSLHAEEAKTVPVPHKFYSFPSDDSIGAPLLMSRAQSLHSYINTDIQNAAHQILQTALETETSQLNASVLVVENVSRNVVAHVSAGERQHEGGWLDLAKAIRSPGSTLKPFIYAVAMSDGEANGASAIRDAPTRFGAYQPENFNRRYYGRVRLDDALKHSLNVPAVAALEQIGPARFESLLVSAGAAPHLPTQRSEDTGLSLALGGAGMTANDLAVLYAALADGGVAKPLNWIRETIADSEKSLRLFSAETAQNITSILADATPPKGRVPGQLVKGRAPIAYKTGTSYGARDSWAAGYTQDYTVIVWVGRPDGAPRPGDTGRKSAAPLLFDIFDRLEGQTETSWNVASIPRTTRSDALPFKTILDQGPQISFPADRSEILVSRRKKSVTLRAQSDKDLRFYVNGEKLSVQYGAADFIPPSAGFYTLKVVDEDGQVAKSRFRILGPDNAPNAPL
jgi:penicillin-binding protein 1C